MKKPASVTDIGSVRSVLYANYEKNQTTMPFPYPARIFGIMWGGFLSFKQHIRRQSPTLRILPADSAIFTCRKILCSQKEWTLMSIPIFLS